MIRNQRLASPVVAFVFDPIFLFHFQDHRPQDWPRFFKNDPTFFLSIIYGAMLTGVDVVLPLTSDNLTAPTSAAVTVTGTDTHTHARVCYSTERVASGK